MLQEAGRYIANLRKNSVQCNYEIPATNARQDSSNDSHDESPASASMSLLDEIVDENALHEIPMSQQKRSYERKIHQLQNEVTKLKRQKRNDRNELKEIGTQLEAAQSKLRKIYNNSKFSI